VTGVVDAHEVEAGITRLVLLAAEAASTLEELVDVAKAAAAVGTPEVLDAVAVKIAAEVERAVESSGAWEAELVYSKIDAWLQTGRHARLLAEAWALVGPGLREVRSSGTDADPA
jgi:hypothetical protein